MLFLKAVLDVVRTAPIKIGKKLKKIIRILAVILTKAKNKVRKMLGISDDANPI